MCVRQMVIHIKQPFYTGKTDRLAEQNLGEHVVLEFAKLLENPTNHRLFFTMFSHHLLMMQLKTTSVCVSGTVRQGRFVNTPFTAKNQFKKKPRGYYEYFGNDSITLTHWNDNNVVTMISNFDHTLPVICIQRHVKGQPGKTQIDQPSMIANCTAGMGGVDFMD